MLFLAGHANKALCSAAILAVLDTLYVICTFRDLKRAMEEATYRNLNGKSAKETMLSEKRVSG